MDKTKADAMRDLAFDALMVALEKVQLPERFEVRRDPSPKMSNSLLVSHDGNAVAGLQPTGAGDYVVVSYARPDVGVHEDGRLNAMRNALVHVDLYTATVGVVHTVISHYLSQRLRPWFQKQVEEIESS